MPETTSCFTVESYEITGWTVILDLTALCAHDNYWSDQARVWLGWETKKEHDNADKANVLPSIVHVLPLYKLAQTVNPFLCQHTTFKGVATTPMIPMLPATDDLHITMLAKIVLYLQPIVISLHFTETTHMKELRYRSMQSSTENSGGITTGALPIHWWWDSLLKCLGSLRSWAGHEELVCVIRGREVLGTCINSDMAEAALIDMRIDLELVTGGLKLSAVTTGCHQYL